MIASIERIPKNARLFLNAFWIRHPKKRKECVEKYGFDPIEDEEMYWMHGLAEKEHRSILRNVIANNGVFSLKFAKMWAASELRSTSKSPSRSRSRSRRRRSPKRQKSPSKKSKRSGLRGGGGGGEGREEYVDKGINPHTGGVIQYLFNLPVKIAATIDSSGRRIVNAFKNTSALKGGLLPWAPVKLEEAGADGRRFYGGGDLLKI